MILAVAVAAVASALPAGTRAMLPTVVATMMATTLTAAVLFLLLGVFRLGNVVRYVPYPVIGGFLAGTGLLLVDGAVNVMSGIGVSASALPLLLHAETLVRWLPGLALAIVLLVVLRLSAHPLALPGLLLGATGVFHIVLWVSGIPAAAARASGWLLGPFPDEGLWQLPTVEFLRQARWDVIVAQSGTLATLLLIALLSFLLNATSLELAAQRDVELDHELKVVGVANVVSGVGGGPVGYHTLGMSALSHRMTPYGRLTGLVVRAGRHRTVRWSHSAGVPADFPARWGAALPGFRLLGDMALRRSGAPVAKRTRDRGGDRGGDSGVRSARGRRTGGPAGDGAVRRRVQPRHPDPPDTVRSNAAEQC